MIVVVDTYNVLHVVGVLPPELAGIDVSGLAQLIEASRYSEHRVELICDGSPHLANQTTGHRLITPRYAGTGREADDLIAALVAESSAPKRLLVVSSDQWVLRQARKRRCRTLTSELFLEHLVHDATSTNPQTNARKPDTLPSAEVARWMDEFSITDEEASKPTRSKREQEEPGPTDLPLMPSKDRSKSAPQKPDREHGPLPRDVIEQAERIWAEEGRRS